MRIHYRNIFIIALAIFVAFSPALFGELCTVDDQDAYGWIANSSFSLKDLFFPHSSGGGYYRPFIGLIYLFDKYVWFLDTRLMHLDNILFHICNALLVYWIATLLVGTKERTDSLVPVAAALLFGLHPITTESVDWISGRTDVMACTFVLLSTVFLLKYRETKKISRVIVAVFMLVAGLLVKETAIAFILGAFFIFNSRQEESGDLQGTRENQYRDILILAIVAVCAAVLMIITYNVWLVFLVGLGYFACNALFCADRDKTAQVKVFFWAMLIAVAAMSVFYFIRKLVFVSSLATIPRAMKLIGDDLNYAFQTFFGAAGFYFKKFFLPFPLNFAIREIDPVYNIVGVILFFVCIYWIKKRTMVCALYLAGVCLFLPALPLSLGTVTWTGYAERYVYISSAFWTIATVLWVNTFHFECVKKRHVAAAIILLVLCLGAATLHRSMIWQTNISILRDTVNKSPNFKVIRVDYMQVLINNGDLEGAKAQFHILNSIPSIGYMEKPDLLMAVILDKEHKYSEASKLYETIIEKTRRKSALAYECYLGFLGQQYDSAKREHNVVLCHDTGSRILELMEDLYVIKKDPMLLYQAGQWAICLGCKEKSRVFFREASKQLPAGDKYARFASNLVLGLEKK